MTTESPVLKQALKADWDSLAAVIRDHYGLIPFSNDRVRLQGTMHDVSHSLFAKLLIPFARLVGALIPYRGRDVPVDVVNESRPGSAGYFWERVFHFQGRAPFAFPSTMFCTGDHQITEFVRGGFGIKLKVSVQDGGLIEKDEGYVLRVGRLMIPLPMNLLMGWASIEEHPISNTEFIMSMVLKHPIFGRTFGYGGHFAIRQEP